MNKYGNEMRNSQCYCQMNSFNCFEEKKRPAVFCMRVETLAFFYFGIDINMSDDCVSCP